jgi:hypothetical protein
MFVFTIDDVIGLSLIGLFAFLLLAIKVESLIKRWGKKKNSKQQEKEDL